MSAVEDGTMSGPGLTFSETVTKFVIIPIALFAVIAFTSWIISAPRKDKSESSITSIN